MGKIQKLTIELQTAINNSTVTSINKQAVRDLLHAYQNLNDRRISLRKTLIGDGNNYQQWRQRSVMNQINIIDIHTADFDE